MEHRQVVLAVLVAAALLAAYGHVGYLAFKTCKQRWPYLSWPERLAELLFYER